jgi:hypothetical protein
MSLKNDLLRIFGVKIGLLSFVFLVGFDVFAGDLFGVGSKRTQKPADAAVQPVRTRIKLNDYAKVTAASAKPTRASLSILGTDEELSSSDEEFYSAEKDDTKGKVELQDCNDLSEDEQTDWVSQAFKPSSQTLDFLPVPFFPTERQLCKYKWQEQNRAAPKAPKKKDLMVKDEAIRTTLADRFDNIVNIGNGDQGTVFSATDKATNEVVALKVLLQSEQREERTKQEFEHSKLLRANKHVLTYSEYFKRERFLVVVTELFANDLGKIVESRGKSREPISEEVIWQYLRDIATGLKGFEVKKLVHRDIKPENLFIRSNGQIVIGDLGLLTITDSENEYDNITGDNRYAALESTEKASTHKWDIAELGFTLLEMTALINLPASGDEWERLREVGGADIYLDKTAYSDELKNLIKMMIHPSPKQRPSATQILDMLSARAQTL